MTQKLQNLAIKALQDLEKDLNEENYNYRYRAWKVMTGKSIISFDNWRNYVGDMIKGMIENYKNNSKDICLRHYFVESFHIRIQVDILGGLKDASGKVEPFEVFAKILLS